MENYPLPTSALKALWTARFISNFRELGLDLNHAQLSVLDSTLDELLPPKEVPNGPIPQDTFDEAHAVFCLGFSEAVCCAAFPKALPTVDESLDQVATVGDYGGYAFAWDGLEKKYKFIVNAGDPQSKNSVETNRFIQNEHSGTLGFLAGIMVTKMFQKFPDLTDAYPDVAIERDPETGNDYPGLAPDAAPEAD